MGVFRATTDLAGALGNHLACGREEEGLGVSPGPGSTFLPMAAGVPLALACGRLLCDETQQGHPAPLPPPRHHKYPELQTGKISRPCRHSGLETRLLSLKNPGSTPVLGRGGLGSCQPKPPPAPGAWFIRHRWPPARCPLVQPASPESSGGGCRQGDGRLESRRQG